MNQTPMVSQYLTGVFGRLLLSLQATPKFLKLLFIQYINFYYAWTPLFAILANTFLFLRPFPIDYYYNLYAVTCLDCYVLCIAFSAFRASYYICKNLDCFSVLLFQNMFVEFQVIMAYTEIFVVLGSCSGIFSLIWVLHIPLFYHCAFYRDVFSAFFMHNLYVVRLFELLCVILRNGARVIPEVVPPLWETQSLKISTKTNFARFVMIIKLYFVFLRTYFVRIFLLLFIFITCFICIVPLGTIILLLSWTFLIICPLFLYYSLAISTYYLTALNNAARVKDLDLYLSRQYATQACKKLRTRKARKFLRRSVFQTQSFVESLDTAATALNISSPMLQGVVSLVESVIFLAYQLSDASSAKMKGIAVATFVKSINGGRSLSIDIMSKVDEAFCDNEAQGFKDFIDSGKDNLSRLRGLRDSSGFAKVQKFMMYVLSLGLFSHAGITMSKAGYSRVEEASLKRKFKPDMNFVDTLLDMVLFICSSGYQIYAGNSIEHIVHSPASYTKFYDDVEIFSQDFARVASNVVAGTEHTKLLVRLSGLLDIYKSIEPLFSQMSSSEKKILLSIRGRLLSFSAQLKSEKICQSARPAPFSLLLSGTSGIGKSVLTEIFFAQFAKIRDLPLSEEMKYVRSPTQEFWDNFDSKMWCLVLDDIAWLHPKAGEVDQSVSELLHIVNNVPYITNQAALDKKGTTPFLGQFVIGTTNTFDLNARSYFSYPAAARRRFPFVLKVTVKPEFANKHGNLDVKEKVPFPNFWNFELIEIIADGHNVLERNIANFSDITDVLTWFNDSVNTFYVRQTQAVDSVTTIHDSVLCSECSMPDLVCRCALDIALDLVPQQQKLLPDVVHVELQSLLVATGAFGFGTVIGYIINGFITAYLPSFVYQIIVNLLTRKAATIPESLRMTFLYWTGQQRKAMGLIGAKVQSRIIATPKIFMILGAAISAGIVAKYMFTSSFVAQGAQVPIPMKKERSDYFYSDTFETTKFDCSLKSRCMDLVSLRNRVSQNIVHGHFTNDKLTLHCKMLGVGGNLYLTNNHSVPENVESFRALMGANRNGISMDIQGTLSENDVRRDPKNDLALVRIVNIPPRCSLLEYFITSKPVGNSTGQYIDRLSSGAIDTIDMSHITYDEKYINDIKTTLFCASSYASCPTQKGQCGMPLIAECGNKKAILGIHSFGGMNRMKDYCGATVVMRSTLRSLMDQFDDSACSDVNPPVLCAQGYTRHLTSLHPKSVFRYIDSGVATVYGSFTGFRPTTKSQVIASPLAPFLKEKGITSDFGKPIMSGWRPWRIAALDMVNPVVELDSSILKDCVTSYLDHIRARVPFKAMKHILGKSDQFTALNGAEGIAFLDGIKRGTSAGAPFCESKRKHLTKVAPERGLSDPIGITPVLQERVDDITAKYARGECYQPVFTAHLKDEAVNPQKQQSGKTRVFCGAPFDWSIVVRQLFLSHVRLMQNYKFAFECGVGTVAPSTEWTDMFKHITKFGTFRIVAGDYKAYDKRMPPALITAAFEVLIVLAEESGNFSREEITSMYCVCKDTAYPMIDFNGDLVTFWGSNPSGHPLTVIINSIANSLYMRYTYALTGNNVATFSDNVSLMTYGDDNIMSVSEDCHNFNHTTIRDALAKIGVVYTMADKEAESVPFIHISDASFLKRSWLWDDEQGVFLAPLEEASIHKMLCVIVKSKTETLNSQVSDIIRCAHREWWHYGKSEFNLKTSLLLEAIAHNGLDSFFEDRKLPTYESLWTQFRECSEKTSFVL